jgi:hypothetical protein
MKAAASNESRVPSIGTAACGPALASSLRIRSAAYSAAIPCLSEPEQSTSALTRKRRAKNPDHTDLATSPPDFPALPVPGNLGNSTVLPKLKTNIPGNTEISRTKRNRPDCLRYSGI